MALQYFGDPGLAAKLTYAGTSGLGEGIGSGLAAFGRGLGRRLEKNEETQKREGQEADALRKLAELRGYASKDQLKVESLGNLRGLVQAKELEGIEQLRAAQLRAYNAAAAENEAQAANIGKAGQFWQALSAYSGSQVPQAPPGPLAPEVLDSFEALAGNYAGGSVGLPQLSSAMALSGYQPTAADMSLLGRMAEGAAGAVPPIGMTVPVTAGGKKGSILFKGTKEGQFVAEDEEKPDPADFLTAQEAPWVFAPTETEYAAGLVNAQKGLTKGQSKELIRRAALTRKAAIRTPPLPGIFGFGGGFGGGASPQPPGGAPAQPAQKKGAEKIDLSGPPVRKLRFENGRLVPAE